MVNETNIKIPKKYEKYIRSVWYEGREDGYWADLQECCLCVDTDCHYVHEWTVKDFLKSLKSIKIMETIEEYHRYFNDDEAYYESLKEVS